MHIDTPGTVDDLVAGRAEQATHPRAQANHQLRGIDRAGELQQRIRHVIALNHPPLAVEGFGELLQPPQSLGQISPERFVCAGDINHQHLATCHAPGDACPAADQRLGNLIALYSHHHALAGGPVFLDLLVFAVLLQSLVDLVRQPQQTQFAERREVADPEVVIQRSFRLLLAVDLTAGEADTQRVGGEVHQLDLVGVTQHLIRHRLKLARTGDGRDHVVERLQMLDVHGGDDVDAGIQQRVHIVPALCRFGSAATVRGLLTHHGVRQLVDKDDLRVRFQRRFKVQFRVIATPVRNRFAGQRRQSLGELTGTFAPVVLHDANQYVAPAVIQVVRFVEHGTRLAHARGEAEVDLQRATLCHRCLCSLLSCCTLFAVHMWLTPRLPALITFYTARQTTLGLFPALLLAECLVELHHINRCSVGASGVVALGSVIDKLFYLLLVQAAFLRYARSL